MREKSLITSHASYTFCLPSSLLTISLPGFSFILIAVIVYFVSFIGIAFFYRESNDLIPQAKQLENVKLLSKVYFTKQTLVQSEVFRHQFSDIYNSYNFCIWLLLLTAVYRYS